MRDQVLLAVEAAETHGLRDAQAMFESFGRHLPAEADAAARAVAAFRRAYPADQRSALAGRALQAAEGVIARRRLEDELRALAF